MWLSFSSVLSTDLHGAPLGDCPAASLGAEMKVSGPALASRGSECAFETRDKRARRDSTRPKCLASTRHDGLRPSCLVLARHSGGESNRVDLAWMGTRRPILGRSHPRRPAPAIGWSRWRGGGGRLRRTPYIWCPSLPVRKRRAAFIVVEDVIIIIAYRKRFAHIAGDFGFVCILARCTTSAPI